MLQRSVFTVAHLYEAEQLEFGDGYPPELFEMMNHYYRSTRFQWPEGRTSMVSNIFTDEILQYDIVSQQDKLPSVEHKFAPHMYSLFAEY